MILTDNEILSSLIINNKDRLIDKVPSLTDEQKQQAKDFFNKYNVYENKIDWNNLNNLTWKDFESVFELADSSKSAKKSDLKKLFQGDNFKIINEDDNFIYVAPLDYEGAKYMDSYECGGAGAKWCIGWEKDKRYWRQYTNGGSAFCLIMQKPNSETTLYNAFASGGDVANLGNMDDTDNKAMIEMTKNGTVNVWSQVKDAKILDNVSLESLSSFGFTVPTDTYDVVRDAINAYRESLGEPSLAEIEEVKGRAIVEFLIEEDGEATDVEMNYHNDEYWSGNGKNGESSLMKKQMKHGDEDSNIIQKTLLT